MWVLPIILYLRSGRRLTTLHSKLALTLGSLMSLVVVLCANGQLTLRSCVNLPRKVTHPGLQMHPQYPLLEVVVMKVVASHDENTSIALCFSLHTN
jgi:hypothetical protein